MEAEESDTYDRWQDNRVSDLEKELGELNMSNSQACGVLSWNVKGKSIKTTSYFRSSCVTWR